jgi:simple sugar transport system ATP-binding protein
VLLISADLDELIGLSDTIRVILPRQLSGDFDPDYVTAEDLGSAMTGAVTDDGRVPGRGCRGEGEVR